MALFGTIAIAAGGYPDVTGQGTAGEAQVNVFSINTSLGRNAGMQFTADVGTGYIGEVTWKVDSVTSGGNYHVEVWSNSGNSPNAQLGGDSDNVNIAAGGVATFTWSSNKPLITDGSVYWLVLVPNVDSQDITLSICNAVAGFKTCRHNTITSMDATSEVNPSYDCIAGY